MSTPISEAKKILDEFGLELKVWDGIEPSKETQVIGELAVALAAEREKVTRLQRGIGEIVSVVIPATGVSVNSESARAARQGILAYSGIDPKDLMPIGGGDGTTSSH